MRIDAPFPRFSYLKNKEYFVHLSNNFLPAIFVIIFNWVLANSSLIFRKLKFQLLGFPILEKTVLLNKPIYEGFTNCRCTE